MKKFKGSNDCVVSDFLLWQGKPTQVVVKDTYDIKVHPVTNMYNEGPINFNIPPQPAGMISNIDIVTSFKVKKGAANLTATDNCCVINNFANALWELVDVKVADRMDLMQSLRNSYAYSTFFNYILNFDKNREDFLSCTQLFAMDTGKTKTESESTIFSGDGVKNMGAVNRSKRISGSKSVTVSTPLHCPLFATAKALPSNMKFRISLSKNSDKFLLIGDSNDYVVHIENIYLNVTFTRPTEIFHGLIEERLLKEPAPYYVTKPEIIIKPVAQQGRIIRLNDIFTSKLPSHCFICLQRSRDFDGSIKSNPFTFIPFSKLQLHVNGIPYFTDPLEIESKVEENERVYPDIRVFLEQLYKTIGMEKQGSCLVDSKNFHLNFIVGLSLTNDRAGSNVSYLAPSMNASTQLEIDMGYDMNVSEDLILIIYALFDRVIKVNADRDIEIIE